VASCPCQPNNLLGCPGGQFIRTGERCGRCTYFWVMVGRLCLALLGLPLVGLGLVLACALYLAYLPFGLLATAVRACMGKDEPWNALDPRAIQKGCCDDDGSNNPGCCLLKIALLILVLIPLTIAWFPIGLAITIVIFIPMVIFKPNEWGMILLVMPFLGIGLIYLAFNTDDDD
jgi:hypothetical protein